MKQLKIVANDYNITNASGVININFNQNIDISPYSSLALDKISMQINPLPSGQFVLQSDQTILLNPMNTASNVAGAATARSITLKAGRYSYNTSSTITPNTTGIPDIVSTLNNLFNGSLDGFPNARPPFITSECDFGLGFLWNGKVNSKGVYSVTLDVYQQALSSSNQRIPNIQQITPDGITGTAAGVYTANTTGDYSIVGNSPLIIGCMQTRMTLILGDIELGGNNFSYGIGYTPATGEIPVIEYGLTFYNGNRVYLINNHAETIEIDIDYFKPIGTYSNKINIWMYTDSSSGHLRLCVEKQTTPDSNKKEVVYTTPINAFTGYDFNNSYVTLLEGYYGGTGSSNVFSVFLGITQPTLTNNNIGYYYDRPAQLTYVATPNLQYTPTRQILIDYSNAPILINNLGFGVNVQVISVSAGVPSTTVAPQGIDFRNWYDLGLDVLNLPIETYVGFSNGQNCGKKNTICYFLLQRISDQDSLFFAESKQLMFLSIENKAPISISSLQFRVYDVNSGLPINASSISFNLFVADRTDDGGHNRAFVGDKRMGIAHDVSQF